VLGIARTRRHKAQRLAAEMNRVLRTQRGLMLRLFGANEPGFHYEAYDPDSIVARRNLLTNTPFAGAAAGTPGTAPTNYTLPVSGGTTAIAAGVLTQSVAGAARQFISTASIVLRPGESYTFAVEFTAVSVSGASESIVAATFTSGSSVTSGEGITAIGSFNGTGRKTMTFVAAAGGATVQIRVGAGVGGNTNGATSVSFKEPQFEKSTTATAYQAVTDWNTEFIAQGGDRVALYQDSVGTLACVTREDPVGLILDRRFMGARSGANLASANYTTAVGADNITNSVSATAFTQTVGTTAGRTYLNLTTVVGMTYEVSCLAVGPASGSATMFARDAVGGGGTILATSVAVSAGTTTQRVIFKATTTTTSLLWTTSLVATTTSASGISILAIPGTHATQSTGTMRALLTARVNKLTKTNQFADAAWSKTSTGTGVVPTVTDFYGSVAAPDGTFTASRVQLSLGGGAGGAAAANRSNLLQTTAEPSGVAYKGLVYIKALDGNDIPAMITASVLFVGLLAQGGVLSSMTPVAVGNGWYLVDTRITTTLASGDFRAVQLVSNPGNVIDTLDCLIWHPECRTADDAAKAIPAYQYVNTASDYDSTGFNWRFREDGTDDFYTGTLDLSGTNKATVISAVTKRSDAATGVVFETSASSTANNGTLLLAAPNGAAANFSWRSKGALASDAVTGNSYAAPITSVLTGLAGIATDTCSLQVNDGAATTSASDQATGNLGNYPFYIGARGGTTLRLAGDWSSLTVRGAETSPSLVNAMKRYQKALAYLAY
jgi:hypothetical protein